MASSKPLIYAELLSNIRQISVIVALTAPCDPTIKVELLEDGCQFNILDHGKSHTLMLPGQADPYTQLQKPALGSKELSWRLPLASRAQRANQEDAQSCDAPWSAKTLGRSEEFACRNCGTAVLKRGSIKTWKDLPSENWAEMMDFWHCHKPDVGEEKDNDHSHEKSDKDLAERGYGANSKFAAQPGVGFVDIGTFLVSESDCMNITVINGKQASDENSTSLAAANSPVSLDNNGITNKRISPVSFPPPFLAGYEEGGLVLHLLFNGLVTDTNTQDKYLFPINFFSCIPSTPWTGNLI